MKTLFISLIISTLLVAACAEKAIETADAKLSAFSISSLLGQWKFKGYTDGKTPDYEVTLEFKIEDGKNTLNGRSSVNFYFAEYEANNETKAMKIGVLGSTKIAGTPEANQFEAIYYERFRNIGRYEFKNNNLLLLHLVNPTNEIMYFERKN
jgi:heat shock protein HslJ